MNDFGNYLYSLRKSKGMTQQELADRLNVTNRSVSKWETGETFPETSQLVPLADIFGVTVDELLRGATSRSDPEPPSETPQKQETREIPDKETALGKYLPDWWRKKFAVLISVGLAVIFAGLIQLIVIGFTTENDFYAIIGTAIFLFCCTLGVDCFMYAGVTNEFAFLPVRDGAWKSNLKRFLVFLITGFSCIMTGTILFVLSAIFSDLTDLYADYAVKPDAALFICGFIVLAVGVLLIVYGGIVWGSYSQKIKNMMNDGTEDEREYYAASQLEEHSLSGKICGAIMLTATAVFLLLGFLGHWWHPGWVVFPVGGVLCGIVSTVLKK